MQSLSYGYYIESEYLACQYFTVLSVAKKIPLPMKKNISKSTFPIELQNE